MGKSTKDKRDIYYRQGKSEGYRARSAYKLLHLNEQYGFLGGAEDYALDAAAWICALHPVPGLKCSLDDWPPYLVRI
ncbi:hypothetical protein [Sporisorium scitamineum]|uniref:Uncharacterized protein n=1 Tax=Sporisorium scitamineum TaxID=49012 RepID=A0A0F7S3T5_9BASI|nr:hypothetical protein [Sporisorium scitamineum]